MDGWMDISGMGYMVPHIVYFHVDDLRLYLFSLYIISHVFFFYKWHMNSNIQRLSSPVHV